jgi:hypothetical protein
VSILPVIISATYSGNTSQPSASSMAFSRNR